MAVKHIVFIRVKAFMTQEEGDDMIKDLTALSAHPLCTGGSAGRNHHSRNRGYEYAMAFDFASRQDEDTFEHRPESKAYVAKYGKFIEDTIVVDFEY